MLVFITQTTDKYTEGLIGSVVSYLVIRDIPNAVILLDTKFITVPLDHIQLIKV